MDETPLFSQEQDRYVVRFRVDPIHWLELRRSIPIHEEEVWNRLSFTKDHERGSKAWTGRIRQSLVAVGRSDAGLIEEIIARQAGPGAIDYDYDQKLFLRSIKHTVRRPEGSVRVSVPDSEDREPTPLESDEQPRDSHRMQALTAQVGAKMGFRVWLPRGDRSRVEPLLDDESKAAIISGDLPLNYDDTTLSTIEQIDVLWLQGRSIARAFEIEHTTSVYSGILRMADLLALQPNMDIRLHIVAPNERRDKVLTEISRPVFSLLDRGPLSSSCSYISYENLRELGRQKHLAHLTDSVLDEYAEPADEL